MCCSSFVTREEDSIFFLTEFLSLMGDSKKLFLLRKKRMAPLRMLDEDRKRRARQAGELLVAKRAKRERPRWLAAGYPPETRRNMIVGRVPPVTQKKPPPQLRPMTQSQWPPLQKPCACH